MIVSDAVFDPTRTYRYTLTRRWKDEGRIISFIGLNPSKATETINDPTVTRCIKYAERCGYSGMHMLNIFAMRSTDPKMLYRVEDPVGPENDDYIYSTCKESDLIVAAWGNHSAYRNREGEVLGLLQKFRLWSFGTTKDGHPRHPLYLAANTPVQVYL